MAFQPEPKQPEFESLKQYLHNSRTQITNNALYQTIFLMIQRLGQMQRIFVTQIDELEEELAETEGGYPNQLGHSSL